MRAERLKCRKFPAAFPPFFPPAFGTTLASMKAFILAGGFATRLWPLTEKRAKPLLPLAGRALLSYVIDAIPQDIPITVSTNAAFAKDFETWRASEKRKAIEIAVEDAGHEDEKVGALGAVAQWITKGTIDEDILLLAGDNYVGTDMQTFLSHFKGNPLVAGHDIGSIDKARQFGTIVLEGEGNPARVASFEEKPKHPKSTVVSTGWWVIPKASLPVLVDHAKTHPDNIGGIFEEFLKRSIPVDCFVFKETWKDIGSFEAYMDLHREVLGKRQVISASSKTVDSTLAGAIDIGPKNTVEKSTLTDCILFGESVIKDCVLERCIIDTDCTLKGIDLTDKMLRAGTILRQKTERQNV
jgi:glucose-1-phosphate thymidylyltransferase